MAPEILERFPAYGTKCDLWSTGVILFVLLGGYLPFDDDTEDGVFNRTRNAQYEFYPDYWNPVSASAKNLVVSMLTINPTKRISAHQALDHEWMRQSKQLLVRRKLSSVVTLQQERNRAKKQDDPRHEKKVAAFTANAHQTNADRMRKLNDAFNSYMTRQDDDTATVFSAPPVKRAEPVEDSAKGFPFKHYYKLGETVRFSLVPVVDETYCRIASASHVLVMHHNTAWRGRIWKSEASRAQKVERNSCCQDYQQDEARVSRFRVTQG